jgi:hypothetical protein
MLQDERFGREIVFVGDDAGADKKRLRSLECVGALDEVGGQTAREQVARGTGGE